MSVALTNEIKTPFIDSLHGIWARQSGVFRNLIPKALPASVLKVDSTGTIVKIKFEVKDEPTMSYGALLLPEIEVPIATDLYGIPPIQKGDKGYCVPSDVYLGGMSGLGDTKQATFAQMPNLSTMVFHPLGNAKAETMREDVDKYYLAGPTGVDLFDLSGVAQVTIGPTEFGPANTMRLRVLINASSDAAARAAGVPLYGLYH